MNANIVIKGLAVVVVAVLFVVIMKGGKSDEAQAVAVDPASELEGLSAIESGPGMVDNGLAVDPLADDYLKDEFGVDVDTPVETMRTLTKETRAVREDSVKLQKENERLKQEISKLLKMEGNLKGRIESRFENAERDAEAKQRELEHTQDLTRGLVARLEKRLEELQGQEESSQTSANGYDINSAGIPTGLGYDQTGSPVDYDQVVWTNPLEARVDPTDPSKISLPDFSLNPDELPAPAAGIARNTNEKSKEERSIKAYTIPDNATLLGSISMTAMLGRIPVGGQVVDPYPFKIMIGPENLSSNGI
ncbi:MAG: TIGR03752 family integrating conjugative element protein, partial [Pseudomonadota bacterium]|nr:TIGR03752 family integrating conjugative element protein [Pseudomonadota bacterium]